VVPELRTDAVQPVRKDERFEPFCVQGEADAVAVASHNVVPPCLGPRQQLLDESRAPVELSDRMCGIAKVQKVENWEAPGPSSVPIDDTEQSSLISEQIAVEEITVGKAAWQVREDRI
jgi:hypothetical protein